MFLLAATSVNKSSLQAVIPLLSLMPENLHFSGLVYILGLMTGLLSFFLGPSDVLAGLLPETSICFHLEFRTHGVFLFPASKAFMLRI